MASIRSGLVRFSPWRCLVWVLAVWMGGLAAVPVPAEAAPAPTHLALAAPDRAAGLTAIQAFLERKVVRQRLSDVGLSPEEIQARLPEMTDDQIHAVASRIDGLQAGGNGLGIAIGILLVVLIIIVILKLTDTKILVTK
ncbi:MAG: PA2779 family protein [candidate division NC10 bacterium]|nr:PA2779 family protein [candidate division NC10 bacterium]